MEALYEILEQPGLKGKELELNRGDFLVHENEKAKHFYWVRSGALRAFKWIEEEEFTIRLAYKNSIVAALPAYFHNKTADLNIQAIRKSKVIVFSKAELDSFFQSDLSLSIKYQKVLEGLVTSFYEREIDLLTQSPADRLKRIRNRSPQVFQEVPHKYIASYLRMSPETLSRLLNS